jgi:hypothetical protein
MKVTIDVRNIHGKANKRHSAFVDYVYGKAVKNQNAEVYLRDKVDLTLVAVNGVIGKRG